MKAELEREYNVRLLHPDRARFHRLGDIASRKAYRELPCVRDIRYDGGERTALDFFTPAKPILPTPVVAFFHGGYWHSHERQQFAYVARCFGSAGIATAIVGYDLAPAVSIACIVGQARKACEWLRDHCAEIGTHPDMIFTAGHSAGAHLAACALTGPKPVARGAILVSGIYNLEPLRSTSLNKSIGLTSASARRWSPALHEMPPRGDLLVTVGAFETGEFLRQSRSFAQRWRAPERASEFLMIPAANHYSIPLELADPGSALSRAAIGRVLDTTSAGGRRRSQRRR